MKRKVVIVIVVAVIILAVAAYIIYKNLKKSKTSQEEEKSSESGEGGGYVAPAVVASSPTFPISKGMSGPQVMAIQDSINKKCKAGLSTDGKFGPMTESALKSCYGVTTVSETLFKQMSSGSDCPSGQYKLPGIGCVPIKSTPAPVTTGGLKKGKSVYAKMPGLVLFQYPAGNSSIGKLPNNFDITKPFGVYEAASSEGFSKVWVNVSGVSHSGSVIKAPFWAYVYTNLIK